MKSSHPEVVVAPRVQPGEILRQERESQGLALEVVAAKLNLTMHALRLLEQGEFERLPGHTFARGYVRAYAKFLGLDADRLVSDFDHYTGTNAAASTVASLARVDRPARNSQSIIKAFSVIALLGLGAAGFFWWQEQGQSLQANVTDFGLDQVEVEAADGTIEIHTLAEPEVIEATIVEPVPEVSEVGETEADVVAEVAEKQAENAAEAPVVGEITEQVIETPAEPVAVTQQNLGETSATASVENSSEPSPAAPAAPANVAAGEVALNLQFTADCWTQVTDATGKVLLSALKYRGDSVELVGKAPLQVRLGYASGAKVLLNGQSVDLEPFTHGETARLTLGQ